ncbi:MAG: hypothetical protein KatS3mg046_675 [Bellilinea sp.]|nr:MAG: hypothetical protein KatS3mg046_675 [Bellilinea sp.]
MIELEPVIQCDICESKDYEELFTRGDLNTFLDGSFKFVRCLNCGLIYQNPRPTKNSWPVLYQEGYDQYKTEYRKGLERIIHSYGLRKRFRSILRYKSSGELLDIGCSTGDFIRYVSTNPNWRTVGIEPSIVAYNKALQLGLNVYNMLLEDFTISHSDHKFDVVTLWNVIEHLFSPTRDIQIIRNHLKPKGLLVITTPDVDSFSAHLFQKYWIGYELPRHFYVFSKRTLRLLLEKSGFELIRFENIYGEHAAFMSSLRFFLRAITNKPLGLELFFGFPIRLFFSPFFRIINIMKKGSWLTVYAKKNE